MTSVSKGFKSTTRRNAVRRLMSDLEQWQRTRHEFPCINAIPLDSNIFEWHCNLAANGGKFAGLVIHLILTFPDTYPLSPPNVKICTRILHPNVFSDWICLDMIRTSEQGQYKGWTPAYSVCSVLMQLQSFLFEEGSIDQDYGGKAKNKWSDSTVFDTIVSVSKFSCEGCGHSWHWVYPPVRWYDRSLLSLNLTRDGVVDKTDAATVLEPELLKIVSIARNDNKQVSQPKKQSKVGSKSDAIEGESEAKDGSSPKFGKCIKIGSKPSKAGKAANVTNGKKKSKKGRNKKINNNLGWFDTNKTPQKVLTMKQYNARLQKQDAEKETKQRQKKLQQEREKERRTQFYLLNYIAAQPLQGQHVQPGQVQSGSPLVPKIVAAKDKTFRFWDGIYYDVEWVIVSFICDYTDLLRLRRVCKQFQRMVDASPYYLRHGLQCWFHKASELPQLPKDEYSPYDRSQRQPLLLGLGITPHFYENRSNNTANFAIVSGNVPVGLGNTSNSQQTQASKQKQTQTQTTLARQIFGSSGDAKHSKYLESIRAAIGGHELLKSVDTTFDLISSDAFETYGVRKNVFKDRQFTHFLPLYMSKSHGKLAMKQIERFVTDIFDCRDGNTGCRCKGHKHMNLMQSSRNYSWEPMQLTPRAKSVYEGWFERFATHQTDYATYMTANDLEQFLSEASGGEAQGPTRDDGAFEEMLESFEWHGMASQTDFMLCCRNQTHEEAWERLHNMGFDDNLEQTENESETGANEANAANDGEEKKQCEDVVVAGTGYHPVLAIYVVANIMKSLIVSVMQKSDNAEGGISLHYSINVLETFFRYHHLLLAIYYLHKKKIKHMIQDQMRLFFKDILHKNGTNGMNGMNGNTWNYRNKANIPDFGVFLMYLTLWEGDETGLRWEQVGRELLDENLTRQVKWVLNKHPELVRNHNRTRPERSQRLEHTWAETLVSRRLFMFQYFFLTQVCQTFAKVKKDEEKMTPKLKYFEYNKNFGRSKDKTLPMKLQSFVKKIQKCNNYKEFFGVIDIKYPGRETLANWLLQCMYQSRDRRYHRNYVYNLILQKQDEKKKKELQKALKAQKAKKGGKGMKAKNGANGK